VINAKVMSKQLRKLGCEVNVAENGLEALNYLATTTYQPGAEGSAPLSMILLDIEMPIMDGLTCIRRIRGLELSGEVSGHVPVIAITANARNEQIAAAIDAGMDSVVTKPFTIKDLVPQMEALVDTWSTYG
jgi:CheY-like chemotaxis protein